MTDLTDDTFKTPPRHQARDIWDQFASHRGALIGMIIFFVILVMAFVGPELWIFDSNEKNIRQRNQGPTWLHPMGTDQLGRDTFAQILSGGRISLAVGIAAMVLSLLLGTLVGVLAGFIKWLDGPLMRLTDLFLALPILPLILVVTLLFREVLRARFGPEAGIFLIVVFIVGITSWMQTARIVRGEVLALKEREFVLAGQSVGTPTRRLITRHILPNVLSPIMVSATLGIANAIITESALSFLGFGFPPDFPTWGKLLNDAISRMELYPMRVFWPGLMISLTVLSVNYMGDGLRDALDPRVRGR